MNKDGHVEFAMLLVVLAVVLVSVGIAAKSKAILVAGVVFSALAICHPHSLFAVFSLAACLFCAAIKIRKIFGRQPQSKGRKP